MLDSFGCGGGAVQKHGHFGSTVSLKKQDLNAPADHKDIIDGAPWRTGGGEGDRTYYVPVDPTKLFYGSHTHVSGVMLFGSGRVGLAVWLLWVMRRRRSRLRLSMVTLLWGRWPPKKN